MAMTAAFLDAQGIMHVVGSMIGPDEKMLAAPPLAARLPPAPASASPHSTSADAILAPTPFSRAIPSTRSPVRSTRFRSRSKT
jgi:hypothetical protein